MSWLDFWDGYLPPTSNTTYTPNQFFDVVLPHAPRGVVRLVAYMIRKSLGWSDAQGRPQEPQVKVSYRELECRAGIAQSKLRAALDEAMEARFLHCVQTGRADARGVQGVSAMYELTWDEGETYVTDRAQFQGFFAGNGNLTYIPNQFFDVTIPQEPLAVIRVVGTIIRHTIGWQTRYGFRRQEIAMSFSELERRCNLSRQSINLALQTALEHRHVVRIDAGTFHSDTAQQKAAVYGIKWADSTAPGKPLDREPNESEMSPPPKVDQDRLQILTRQPPPNLDQDRFQKLTRTASKSRPEHRLQKLTSNKITPIQITPNKITQEKQQQQTADLPADGAAAALVARLVAQEVNRGDAVRLANALPEECRRQLEYLPYKEGPFTSSKGAYLRRAIEQGFAPPKRYLEAQAQRRKAEKALTAQQQAAARQRHHEAHAVAYAAYLCQAEQALRAQQPATYAAFAEDEQRQRQRLVQGPGKPDSILKRKALEHFDSATAHQERLLSYFREHPEWGMLSFEQWDQTLNPNPFRPEIPADYLTSNTSRTQEPRE